MYKNIAKKYAFYVQLDSSKVDFQIKGWNRKSKVYFKGGGYPSSIFTVDANKAKLYNDINKAIGYLKFFYGKYIVGDITVVEFSITTIKEVKQEICATYVDRG